jgi:hypothetical protein
MIGAKAGTPHLAKQVAEYCIVLVDPLVLNNWQHGVQEAKVS